MFIFWYMSTVLPLQMNENLLNLWNTHNCHVTMGTRQDETPVPQHEYTCFSAPMADFTLSPAACKLTSYDLSQQHHSAGSCSSGSYFNLMTLFQRGAFLQTTPYLWMVILCWFMHRGRLIVSLDKRSFNVQCHSCLY